MSRRWRGRALSHELAIGRLTGRPLLWACPSLVRHRQGTACVDQRGVIVGTLTDKSVIPLFDPTQHHSSVPTTFATAVARGGCPGRPRGRGDSASPLTAASTMAALRSFGAIACIVAIFASSMLFSVVADAARAAAADHPADGRTLHPFAALINQAAKTFAAPTHSTTSVM